jgi:hypothetical protein
VSFDPSPPIAHLESAPRYERISDSGIGLVDDEGGRTVERGLGVLSWVAAVLYVGVGVLELLLANDPLRHRAVFVIVLCVLALLVVGGVRLIATRPWAGAGLASVGAVAGAVALFWTVAAIVLGIAIVILAVIVARRGSPRPRVQPA